MMTLGRVRILVQAVTFLVLVYGGNLFGYYLAQKLSQSFPSLACAFNQETGAYCTLISLQHGLYHRVGEGYQMLQRITVDMLLPTLFTFLTFLAFFVVLNKTFCAWICPLGTVQEWLYALGRRLSLPFRRLEGTALARVRPVKWVVLIALVLVIPLVGGLGYGPHALVDPFCQLCPSRMVNTLLTANVEQGLAVPTNDWASAAFAAGRNMLFGFVIVAALVMRQPFCRICPMLALHAAFRRVSPLRLVKVQHDRCASCGICTKACPMDIPEISACHGAKAFHADCTMCGRCAEFCPDDGIIKLKWGPVTLFSSAKEYFRRRLQREKPDGTPVKVKAPARRPSAAE